MLGLITPVIAFDDLYNEFCKPDYENDAQDLQFGNHDVSDDRTRDVLGVRSRVSTADVLRQVTTLPFMRKPRPEDFHL